MRTALILLAITSGLGAQTLAPAPAGMVRDRAGRVRAVRGIAGAFTLGPPVAEEAFAAAASASYSVVKAADRVLLFDNSGGEPRVFPAPEGTALFAFDPAGKPAFAWFPATHELLSLDSGARSPLDVDGVLALAARQDGGLDALLFRDGALWRGSLDGGAFVITSEPLSGTPLEAAPPAAFLADGGVAWYQAVGALAGEQTGQEWTASSSAPSGYLVVRARDGSERRVSPGLAVRSIERMSDDWLLLRGPDDEPPAAARLDGDAVRLCRIPEEPR